MKDKNGKHGRMEKWCRFLNGNIGRKIIILFIPAFSLILIAAFMLVYYFCSQKLVNRVLYDTNLTMESASSSLDSYFNDIKTPLAVLSNNDSLRQLLRDNHGDADFSRLLLEEREIQSMLNTITTLKPFVGNIMIFGRNGIHMDMLQSVRDGYDMTKAGWIKDTRVLHSYGIHYIMPHTADYYEPTTKPYSTAISAIIPVMDSQAVSGYIMVDISTSRIDSALQNLALTDKSQIYLMDQSTSQIYKNGKTLSAGSDLPKEVLSSEKGYQVVGDRLIVYTTLESWSWKLIIISPYKAIVAPATDVFNICFITLFITILLISFLSFIISRKINRPIAELIVRINQVEHENFTPAVPTEQYGEIGLIRREFEDMVGRIDSLINEVYISNIRQKEMEYTNLVNQINPHFLYNVLQLIQTEAVLSDNETINDIVVRLSYLLRYSMNNANSIVTFEEMYEFTGNYLELYRKRFTSTFSYSMELDERLRKQSVLKFILQPIVENSIRHGFKDKKNGGQIDISIYLRNHVIYLEVYDNGQGIPPERLKEIRNSLNEEPKAASIGLQNTNQRINIRYGSEYGISIDSEYQCYTRVICTLPYLEGENGNV